MPLRFSGGSRSATGWWLGLGKTGPSIGGALAG
jgi:hypothetical protein